MSYKVLIIEDDPMVAMINEQYVLKNPDFTVAGSVRNGKDALEFLAANKVDLIIMDIFMPYEDGIETLKKIRGLNIQAEVIMVTAANDTATLEQSMNLGVVDYLIKPFALERFLIALEKFAAKASTLKNKEGVLDQSSIDSIISGGVKNVQNAELKPATKNSLPKGIQQKTLEKIVDYFKKNPNLQSGDIVAGKLGLSIVTVRHYLNYLVENHKLEETVNYETGGRPCMLYKKYGR